MVHNTENGASLQKSAHHRKKIEWLRKKIVDIIVGNWEKRKQNTKYFSETTRVDLPEPSVHQSRQKAVEWKCLGGNCQEL